MVQREFLAYNDDLAEESGADPAQDGHPGRQDAEPCPGEVGASPGLGSTEGPAGEAEETLLGEGPLVVDLGDVVLVVGLVHSRVAGDHGSGRKWWFE